MMKNSISILLCLILFITLFSGCKSEETKVTDIIQEASVVTINGTQVDTVEASMGAFDGKQGDYIEFRFSEPQTFNTIFIIEKTTSVRQYNVYAEVDGKYKLVHTGKNIFPENIIIEPETASAIKLEIVNTEIGNDSFTIQGVSAYDIKETQNGN